MNDAFRHILLVATGGALGAVARFKLGGLILHQSLNWKFPLGTFAVNVLGCLVAGLLTGLVVRWGEFSEDTRLFLFTGLLGGFTTFSAFGVETFALLKRDENLIAFAYVSLSVLCGLAALWLAFLAVSRAPA